MKVLTPQALKCPITNKSAYVSRETALRIVERSHTQPDWEMRHGAPAERVYVCPHCAWWHLTKGKGRANGEVQQHLIPA